VSECVACGRAVEVVPVGPSRTLCSACQTRLGHGDPEVEAALAPVVTEERPDDSFLRQDVYADPQAHRSGRFNTRDWPGLPDRLGRRSH
jgi:hypothetical protein